MQQTLPVDNSPNDWDSIMDRVLIDHGCWLWTGSLRKRTGYGQVWFGGRNRLVHRVVWFLFHGRWPSGMLLHSCDVKRCVAPYHLSEGTAKRNHAEAIERGLVVFRGGRWRTP